jgi:hypothetical protein
MRAAITALAAVLLLAGTAAADPDWRAQVWDATATVLHRVATEKKLAPELRARAARGAFRARLRALARDVRVRPKRVPDVSDDPAHQKPRPLDPESQRLVSIIDTYLELAPTEYSEDTAHARFLRANTYRRYDQLDKAIPDFVTIVEHERTSEVGVYAVNLLLDSLNRAERYDELVRWARTLRTDAVLLERSEDLGELLVRIDAIGTRKEAEQLEKAHDYIACAAAYDRTRTLEPDARDLDERLFNAAICFEQGKAFALALARHGELMRSHPRSSLAGRAAVRATLLVAALALERLARPITLP